VADVVVQAIGDNALQLIASRFVDPPLALGLSTSSSPIQRLPTISAARSFAYFTARVVDTVDQFGAVLHADLCQGQAAAIRQHGFQVVGDGIDQRVERHEIQPQRDASGLVLVVAVILGELT